jgi:hypothetical protein
VRLGGTLSLVRKIGTIEFLTKQLQNDNLTFLQANIIKENILLNDPGLIKLN